jgi:hypothetical protein
VCSSTGTSATSVADSFKRREHAQVSLLDQRRVDRFVDADNDARFELLLDIFVSGLAQRV